MKLFVVNEDKTLQTADNPALKLYNKVNDAEADISNLDIGQLIGTVQSTVPTEDFQSFLDYLQRIIPAGTSEGNMLVNQSQIPDVAIEFDSIRGRIVALEDEMPNKADINDLNQLAARVGVNETNIANLSDQVTNVETAVSELADCSGLNCTGTLTEDDIVGLTDCKGTVTGIYDKVGNTTFYPNEDGIVTVELASGGGDSLPAGTVIPYAGPDTPNGWFPCDGREVSRDEYPALFEAIGTTYGAGDGTTTFKLPDYREVALVGIGTSDRTEGVHSPYTLGQFKDDQIQNITGRVAIMGNGVNNAYWIPTAATGAFKAGDPVGGNDAVTPNVAQNQGRYLNFDASGSVRTGGETRGKRIGVNYIIKWTRQGSSEDQNDIDTIVRNRVMAALSKANEDLYKNLQIKLLTGPTAMNQTYTVPEDGVYVFRANYRVVTTSGSIIFVVNGVQAGVKGLSAAGWMEYTVTYELKKGDTFLVRPSNDDVPNNVDNFSTSIYYTGRLDLTAGFPSDWDWGGGTGGGGLTEEEVKELIKEANKPVQINTIQWDTSSGITAKADNFQCYRSGNTISLTINALEITNVVGSPANGFGRILKGLPGSISRVYIQVTNVKNSEFSPAYLCIDQDGYLNIDNNFNKVGDKAWISITYITKDE